MLSAALMIANLPSWSWRIFRIRARFRLPALLGVALLFAVGFTQPWDTLGIIAIGYLLVIPIAWWRYARIDARRGQMTVH
jgi:CDP-diacylglycerol--serine O-phosphatidyltransferase